MLLEKHEGSSTMWLNWSVGGPRPLIEAFSACPTGPLERSWWEAAAADAGVGSAERFFVWWSKDRSKADWEKTARLLMWSELRWHPPQDEREQMTTELALECVDQAGRPRDLGGEAEELRAMLAAASDEDNETVLHPRTEGLGFFRGAVRYSGPGDWAVTAPGYYYEGDDDGQMVLWYPGRTIRVSAMRNSQEEGGPGGVESAEEFAEVFASAPGEVVEMAASGVYGKCGVEPPGEEDCWNMQGLAASGPCLALMTVSFEDPDDQDWAIELFQSIQPPHVDEPDSSEDDE